MNRPKPICVLCNKIIAPYKGVLKEVHVTCWNNIKLVPANAIILDGAEHTRLLDRIAKLERKVLNGR